MKISTSTVVFLAGIVAGIVAGSPFGPALKLETRAAVTESQFSNFKLFAEYAGASYCSNNDDDSGGLITCADDVCPTVESNGAKSIVEFTGDASTDQEGYVAIDPVNSLIVVALRGTDSIVDYIDDILFLYTSCDFVSGCKVHSGFWDNWVASKSTILSAVETATASYPSYSLVLTGHSLGAAVATIAAAYLRGNGYPCDLYTYGSPRVGNGIFADFVSGQAGVTARITHYNDVVPRLPPLLTGYRHTSPEYWLSDGTDTTNNYNISDIKVCLGDKNTDCNAGESGLDFTGHDHYFEYITACAPSLSLGKREVSFTWQTQLETFGDLDSAYYNALAQTNATADSTIQLMGDVAS